MCDGTIRPKDLPDRVRDYRSFVDDDREPTLVEEWPALSTVEGRYVARVLAHTRGNKQAAARVLEIDRKTLDRMMKRHGIVRRRETAGAQPPVTRGANLDASLS
jgi:transcriptional regulator of acetoin/glycerol metabolism